jgi:transposase
VCKPCDAAFNADVNGAENIRLNINTGSNSESSASLDADRSTGWLAQPAVSLHELSSGFQPQEQVVDCKLSDPTARDSRVDETEGLVRTPEISDF